MLGCFFNTLLGQENQCFKEAGKMVHCHDSLYNIEGFEETDVKQEIKKTKPSAVTSHHITFGDQT